MRLYLSVLAFLISSSNMFWCNFLQIDVLYHVPPVIQSELCFSISYSNCLFVPIIYYIPTWCNTVFNTNEVIIPFYLVFISSIDEPVCFPQLLHLISICSTVFWSSCSLLYQQLIWNIENIFTNYGKSVVSLSILSAVYSMIFKNDN